LPQFRNHSELLSVRKLWEHFQLLPLSSWLYHTKQGCYLTHIWEYIFPHFTLRTQHSSLFQDIMTHVLIVCSRLGNSFFWSCSFTNLVLIEHFHCAIITKHSMSLKRIKSNMRT
jgi:hypothetical protein